MYKRQIHSDILELLKSPLLTVKFVKVFPSKCAIPSSGEANHLPPLESNEVPHTPLIGRSG